MFRPKKFVTGATGFLGSHLTFRLLQDGHRVCALARGSKASSARARVERILTEVAGPDETLQRMVDRLEVVEGDISQPNLGLNPDAIQKILSTTDEIWHCAASLSFAEEDREEILTYISSLKPAAKHKEASQRLAGKRR